MLEEETFAFKEADVKSGISNDKNGTSDTHHQSAPISSSKEIQLSVSFSYHHTTLNVVIS